ncbi:MAG: hypothetical protein COV65_07145 [Nitrosopumilales archaeon CG11_big_fil_rev_8_21_14_0_20_33_24]|nr:MAG: hypothetical protein COV65_07145 [Nitrosopumilales archaeon CG11_big_fil_rev_8_21_14_0_20_33_24]
MYDKQLLYNLVMECETYRLSEKESMDYIRKKTDGECIISRRHYSRIKRRINSEDECKNWLNNQARFGFVSEHKKRIDEMEMVLRKLMKLLLSETAKDESKQDRHLILKTLSQIESANKRLSELSLGSPVIAEIKNQVKEKENAKGIPEGTEDNIKRTDQNRIF